VGKIRKVEIISIERIISLSCKVVRSRREEAGPSQCRSEIKGKADGNTKGDEE